MVITVVSQSCYYQLVLVNIAKHRNMMAQGVELKQQQQLRQQQKQSSNNSSSTSNNSNHANNSNRSKSKAQQKHKIMSWKRNLNDTRKDGQNQPQQEQPKNSNGSSGSNKKCASDSPSVAAIGSSAWPTSQAMINS